MNVSCRACGPASSALLTRQTRLNVGLPVPHVQIKLSHPESRLSKGALLRGSQISRKLYNEQGSAQSVNRRQVTRMGNKNAGGPFSPLVNITRNIVGKKEFNKFRGKMISLHSQVIKAFGAQVGANYKQVEGLIRVAKKNGEKLGFLA